VSQTCKSNWIEAKLGSSDSIAEGDEKFADGELVGPFLGEELGLPEIEDAGEEGEDGAFELPGELE